MAARIISLKRKDFGPEYHDAALEAGKAGGLLKQMIWIFHFIQSLPEWLAVLISPSLGLVIRLQRVRPIISMVHHLMRLTILVVNRAADCPGQISALIDVSRSCTPNPVPRDLEKQAYRI